MGKFFRYSFTEFQRRRKLRLKLEEDKREVDRFNACMQEAKRMSAITADPRGIDKIYTKNIAPIMMERIKIMKQYSAVAKAAQYLIRSATLDKAVDDQMTRVYRYG
ncbi:Protein of unknown function [Pyronema omphalodes CBS 100304]|uniref:Uncharacterized protein n=1 Tax=Pyronema omphalodes (strain CBS 100304) TaxID=1076935 RepID=U4L6B8_PYROM|nr:Protein of unknown function [Pyronema omphalodes CBS 100304]